MNSNALEIKQELETHQEFLKANFFAVLWDIFAVKVDTMRGNTARAYKRGKCYQNHTPTSIFKHWLHNYFFNDAETLRQLEEGTNFELIHASAVDGLKRFWEEKEAGIEGMAYYHYAKLIDLLFKSVARWDKLSEERRLWFFEHVNVPLDKYSLLILREFNPNYHIPAPSMNFVKDKEHYDKIQKDIREMIAPFSPLLFDLYAWDYRRRNQIISEEKFELIDAMISDGAALTKK